MDPRIIYEVEYDHPDNTEWTAKEQFNTRADALDAMERFCRRGLASALYEIRTARVWTGTMMAPPDR